MKSELEPNNTSLHMLNTEKLITIRPSKIICILGFIVASLVLANIAVQLIKFVEWHTFLGKMFRFLSYEQIMQIVLWIPKVRATVYVLDMGIEHNIPTYFSSVIILIAALLLNTIATFKKGNGEAYALHWRILAIIFVYLSMDEMVGIHEMASGPTQKALGTRWLLHYYAWVIPGSVLVLIFALSYFRFLLHLPLKSKLLFSIAGVIYVGGAIGMELVSNHYDKLYGVKNLTYHMIVTVEETLEMAGIILFIHALLDYIRSNIKEIRLHIKG